MTRGFYVIATLVVALALTRTARADLTLENYNPAPTAADGFQLSRPDIGGHLKVGAQVQLDFARNPLVWERNLGNMNTEQQHVVHSQLVGHAIASFSIFDRALFFVHVPVNLMMSGTSIPEIKADGAGLGNIQLGARVRLLGDQDDLFGLAVQGALGVPSSQASNTARLSGESLPTGDIQAIADLRPGRFHITANVGAHIRDLHRTVTIPGKAHLLLAGGAGYTFFDGDTKLEILAEIFGGGPFLDHFGQREQTPFEALGGAKIRHVKGFVIGGAGGGGFTRGIGAPDWRVIGQLAYQQPANSDKDKDGILDKDDQCIDDPEDKDSFEDTDGCPDPDNDKDGILDVRDKCPLEAEDQDGWEDDDGCPDPDNDHDGILDVNDKCPNEAEDLDGFQDEDGCPDPDNDNDGVLDANDKCPTEAEDRDGFQDDDGCPDPDNDGDGIPDDKDQCPLEAETFNQREDEDGCPDLIRIDREKGQIQILEPVRFATNSSTILPASFEMLIEIAAVLQSHPEIALLGVEGHTDSRGNDAKNQKLSDARANSVRDFLIKNGVAENRLVARGLGETRPVATNDTDAGRQKNRRVEFHIGGFGEATGP